eukprot:TRINITY_DN10141_c0_g1_i1.p1 TRINITY_DN10141_c0_g1~~TRINITY_DN10141_c0_g1_i1.p1  ORF type:complete len:140 (+),score=32.63 TRINITY_DN10141_c0_g1_i1:206-625(+)
MEWRWLFLTALACTMATDSTQWAEPVTAADTGSCGMEGCGKFMLNVDKITRAGTEAVVLRVSPMDTVQEVVNRLNPGPFKASLRLVCISTRVVLISVQHGEYEALPSDLPLLDVGLGHAGNKADLMITDMMRGPPPRND